MNKQLKEEMLKRKLALELQWEKEELQKQKDQLEEKMRFDKEDDERKKKMQEMEEQDERER